MAETARDLGKRWFEEVWNRGRREAIAEMLAPTGVIHEGETDSIGPEGFYPFFERINGAFSQIRVTVEDTLLEGNRACIRWSFSAQHTGGGLGFPPTGKTVRLTGISVLQVDGGKIVEGWQNWDMLGMLEQIQDRGKKAATYIAAS